MKLLRPATALGLLLAGASCLSPPRVQLGNRWHGTASEAFFQSDIVAKFGCVTCHTVGDRGGTVGPILNNVGFRRSKEWIRKWLQDPNAVKNGTAMPQFPFTPEELDQAVGYLSSMKLDLKTDSILRERTPDVQKGEKLFEDYDCFACHRVGDRGRFIGPNLTWVGRRKSRRWETLWLKDPPGFKPGTFMPNFHLAPETIDALTAFLHSLQGQKNDEARGWERRSSTFFEYGATQRGELVFDRLACAACHGERLRRGVANPNAAPKEVVPAIHRVVGKLTAEDLRRRLEQGEKSQRLDPNGPEPLYDCPAYPGALDDQDLEALLAYLKSLAPKKRRWSIQG